MKLLRFGETGQEKPGILDEQGKIRDASSLVSDWNGDTLDPGKLASLSGVDNLPEVDDGVRIGSCIARPGKIIAIGLNYVDHAEETNSPIPKEPIVFMKANTSFCGPFDNVIIPRGSTKTDWEVELGIVIGKKARYIEEANSLDYVAGYCVVHDVSEREHQLEKSGQWVKGKSHDNFSPTGPWLVTKDEVGDVNNLSMWLDVDGERRQTGNTSTMIFNAQHLVYYLSQFMTLEPGDLITTGTPPGVGMGMNPQVFLKAGQKVTLGVDKLGEQTQDVVDAS